MKKLLFLFALVTGTATTFAQKASHVILITIDGFRPDFYLDASWGMPNLRRMMDSGVCAKGVNPVFPSVTFPNHTTIVTGVTPAKHGIYYNAPFEPAGATGKWYWYYNAIQVPTLWDAVHQAGKTSANVIWPVTVGGPIDYNIPDIWPLGKGTDRREATRANDNPANLLEELEENATGKLSASDLAMDREELIMDENIARMAAYLVQTYKPGFTALHLPCTDHYEHAQGRDGYLVRKSVSGADRALESILAAVRRAGIEDSTTIIVTGDHGFVNISRSFNPNVLLAKNGLITDIKKEDWKAQFLASGGSAFLHLKDKNDTKTLNQVLQLLQQLPTEQQQLFRIINKKQLTEIGADPNAALALTALGNTTIGGASTGDLVKSAKGGTHGYFPDFKEIQTGFVAYGAGIKKGQIINEMNLVDVAPVIAQLMGLNFPGTEGKVPAGIMK